MAYQMAPTAVTLNGLEGHSPVVGISSAISRRFAQQFTRFQLTARDSWTCCILTDRVSISR